MAKHQRDAAKEAYWRGVLIRQAASGLVCTRVLPAGATHRVAVLRLAADDWPARRPGQTGASFCSSAGGRCIPA